MDTWVERCESCQGLSIAKAINIRIGSLREVDDFMEKLYDIYKKVKSEGIKQVRTAVRVIAFVAVISLISLFETMAL
jgi:hypothetical protein